jgi:hypothetical protein
MDASPAGPVAKLSLKIRQALHPTPDPSPSRGGEKADSYLSVDGKSERINGGDRAQFADVRAAEDRHDSLLLAARDCSPSGAGFILLPLAGRG